MKSACLTTSITSLKFAKRLRQLIKNVTAEFDLFTAGGYLTFKFISLHNHSHIIINEIVQTIFHLLTSFGISAVENCVI